MRGAGFTLFEVAISLALVAVSITSAVLVFPLGLRSQQLARFQLYAAAKAEELVESFACSHNCNTANDMEAFAPWDVPTGSSVLSHDLEARLCTPRFGIMPLPTAIARRLDSADDEIQRILDQGGSLYYAPQTAASETKARAKIDFSANEVQKLVFAVAGCAQQDAIQVFPYKAWPYYYPYPSPPAHGHHFPAAADFAPPGMKTSGFWGLPIRCWEQVLDADIGEVFRHDEAGVPYGYEPYAYGTPDLDGAVRYLQMALWYAERKGCPASFSAPTAVIDDFAQGGAAPPWQQVTAMRFLAHAATCLTRWKTLAELGGQPSGAGFAIPSATIAGVATPAIELTHDRILAYHESSLRLAMRFCAANPYDWSVPRPVQRATMMDYPLLCWDLFSPPSVGSHFDRVEGAGTVPASQWRALSASPIVNLGRSWEFPDRDLPATIWGDAAHFTLCDPFAPAERCRELVFWSVDWLSYVDCETCPSAAIDAGKYPIAGPLMNRSFADRMGTLKWCDASIFSFRNPEKDIVFTADVSDLPTGADISGLLMPYTSETITPDAGAGLEARARFLGRYGADRNGDNHLDRGPLPASARLRAQLAARLNFYDPRVPAILR